MKSGRRGLVMLIHLWPTLHFLLVVCLWRHPGLALSLLYLLPPMLARLVIRLFGRPVGCFSVDSREFLVWWTLACLQSVFLRFPGLEEALRMIPLLYSAWLRLWGGKVGRFVYWAPGTTVLDRSYVEIGDQVIFGMGVRLNPHLLSQQQLTLAPVTVGAGAQVGGYSLLMAGSEIGPGETSLATLEMRPFSRFVGGKLWRRPKSD